MSFKPNTTIYLCAGTGLDSANSVFMPKYAYPAETPEEAIPWWSALFQWFKAHSIAEGYWCYTFIDPSKGYVDVGRTPLSTGSKGQSGLGNAAKQAELDGNQDNYAEAIRAIDWIVFSNGVDEYSQELSYCMVDRIDFINFNTARIYFTVDALLTYQKYFWFGRSFVERDMQYGEWESAGVERTDAIPTYENLNLMSEPTPAAESDYVLQHITADSENQDALEKLNFGAYNQMFCSTDVDLQTIKASESSPSIPNFEPSESTKIGDVHLGIGVYRYTQRKNEAFTKLGSFNAMEHLLACYMLPEKLVKPSSAPIEFLTDARTIIADDYLDKSGFTIKIPNWFIDSPVSTLTDAESPNAYKPLNFKCYSAPYSYISISDKQGSSIEILPQLLGTISKEKSYNHFYSLVVRVDATAAPNMPSNLKVVDMLNAKGSAELPFMTLWQFSSYAMTPNASGYNQVYANNIASVNAATNTFIATGVLATIVSAAAIVAGARLGADDRIIRGTIGAAASLTAGKGLNAMGEKISAEATRENMIEFGLPKATGGLTNNMTVHNMNNAGYEFYWCHMRTDLIKIIDYTFSILGYAQNAFRYPHINTRKRWCYVKLSSVNLRPQQANNFDLGGLPSWAKSQIEQRLKSGVTFWNLRHAMGDSPITDYSAMPSDIIKMGFIRNYGASIDSEEMRDNTDRCDGYAEDYSDEVLN